jgi:AmmeMemoRadiSam system protein A
MLTHEEKRRLLTTAREAIRAALEGWEYRTLPPAEGPLAEHRGAFVTLRTAGHRLRGCVGYPAASIPLLEVVAEAAPKAALHDFRFDPVTNGELDGLRIEISVLTPFTPIAGREDLVIGRDGLMIDAEGKRGLLLPQVALEFGWDAEQFLDAVCEKAGLPPGSWHNPGTRLYRFGAELAGEESGAS